MPLDMDIPADEVRDAVARVAVFARPDAATTALGCVRLHADGTRRHWVATDGSRFAHLAGGASDVRVQVSVPPGLLALPAEVAGMVTLTIPERLSDGRLDGPLQLATAELAARQPPGPPDYPDWRALLDEAGDAPAVEVTVHPRQLAFALSALTPLPGAQEVPTGPRCWLEADTRSLRVARARPDGREERAMPAGGDGEASVLVESRHLQDLLDVVDGEELRLHLPLEPRGAVWTAAGDWTAWIRPVDRDDELRELRGRLAQLLIHAYGAASVVQAEGGHYQVARDDTTVSFLLVDGQPPVVRAEAVVADRVTKTRPLLDAINDANANLDTARLLWANDQVLAQFSVSAGDLVGERLDHACQSVLAARAALGPVLRARLAGDEDTTTTATGETSEEAYRATRITVEVEGEDVLFAADGSRVPHWPFGSEPKIHVLTAYNPGDEEFSYHDNERAQAQLEAELRAAGHGLFPAVLRAPDGSWRERGTAASGLRTKEAAAVGRRYGQRAIFELTADGVHVVSTGP